MRNDPALGFNTSADRPVEKGVETIFWIDLREDIAAIAMIQLMGRREIPLRKIMQVLTYSAVTD